jgi:hypothetical protein
MNMALSNAELIAKVGSTLKLIDRRSYSCVDDLAEAIQQDYDLDAGEITEHQFDLIAELVADWWILQS